MVSTEPTSLCDDCKFLAGGHPLTDTVRTAHHCIAGVTANLPPVHHRYRRWPLTICSEKELK